ncbi:hypothetical protein Agub_g3181 [Astrephomene gubernaculifera]|uniref:MRH domain-containing protein n=1 Tax=Astrephomene gubernaculifera TaxID=47775 RepID=A0AAD3DIR3_9CHLO|nr:hypothetical protein Agub_g3181 [Astrephomene gubernaculifera]
MERSHCRFNMALPALLLLLCIERTALGAGLGVIIADAPSAFAMPSYLEPKYIVTLAGRGGAASSSAGLATLAQTSLQSSPSSAPSHAIPASSGGSAAGARRVRVTAADGTRYECTLPEPEAPAAAAAPSAAAEEAADASAVVAAVEAAAAQAAGGVVGRFLAAAAASASAAGASGAAAAGDQQSPFELLEAMTALCLYRQEGLWTYEVCYKKQARQFRQDGAGRGEDFSCGTYPGDEQQEETVQSDSSSTPVPIRYVRHVLKGGARCELTGGPRSAEVRFTCLPGTSDNAIVSVKEFPTCNYVFVVSTPFLCKHPEFKPEPEKHLTIGCVPVEEGEDEQGSAGEAAREEVKLGEVPERGSEGEGGEVEASREEDVQE